MENKGVGDSGVGTNRCLIVGIAGVDRCRRNLRVGWNTPVALSSAICMRGGERQRNVKMSENGLKTNQKEKQNNKLL